MNKLGGQDRIKYHLNDIDQVSDMVVDFIFKNKNKNKATIIELDGEMGYGKTTLVSNICKKLGIKDQVSSPTFVYFNEYCTNEDQKLLNIIKDKLKKIKSSVSISSGIKLKDNTHNVFNKIIHIDAYRIDKSFNINSLQLQKYLDDNKCLIFIEWNKKLLNYKTDIVLILEKVKDDQNKRYITISKN
jgi:tRNA A37 threonylcarbamoyladenosine biosynthesis protein TsaE